MRHILEVDRFYIDQLEATGSERRGMGDDRAIETLAELAPARRAMDRRLIA